MHKPRSQFFMRQILVFFLVLQWIFPLPLLAQVTDQTLTLQTEDIIAPKVIHQQTNRGVNPNGTYFFASEVTDDVAVQSVTLFYRTKGDQQYIAIPMTTTKPPLYTALLAPDSVKAPGIEYYIQAKDSSGNAVLVGAAFSPLSMSVAAPKTGKAETLATQPVNNGPDAADQKPEKEKSSSNAKWWWIAAGVVAVALIAGGGGGGGGGGGDDPAPPPTTGGITVTAPLPQ